MPGRPPTPIALHKVRGTYKKALHAGKVDAPDVALGEPPSWMTPVQIEEWDRIKALTWIREADRPTVEHACVLYGRFVEDAQGTRTMTASERQTFHSVGMQLGRTPSARAKISAPTPAKADDPWAALG